MFCLAVFADWQSFAEESFDSNMVDGRFGILDDNFL